MCPTHSSFLLPSWVYVAWLILINYWQKETRRSKKNGLNDKFGTRVARKSGIRITRNSCFVNLAPLERSYVIFFNKFLRSKKCTRIKVIGWTNEKSFFKMRVKMFFIQSILGLSIYDTLPLLALSYLNRNFLYSFYYFFYLSTTDVLFSSYSLLQRKN